MGEKGVEPVFKILDKLRVPRILEIVWRLMTGATTPLEQETNAGISVLGTESVSYNSVRVAQGGILGVIFRFNGGRAFTTFHTINLPRSGGNSRSHLDIIVHELTHVCQFEVIGSVYIWQALRAQRTAGYSYGGWQQLRKDRDNDRHYRDYNREQQGQMAQDYYNEVIAKCLSVEDPVRQAYEPFIDELRNREL
jgi:hypothetical protein